MTVHNRTAAETLTDSTEKISIYRSMGSQVSHWQEHIALTFPSREDLYVLAWYLSEY